jgi:hypothetical protein
MNNNTTRTGRRESYPSAGRATTGPSGPVNRRRSRAMFVTAWVAAAGVAAVAGTVLRAITG